MTALAQAKPLFLPVAAALLLGACGPLVQIGAKGPPAQSLLLIEATASPTAAPAPTQLSGPTIAVALPQVPTMLQTLRLAVRTDDNEIQYLSAASWAESPGRLVQHLLADTLAARGLAVIDRSQASAPPDAALSGTLREFTLDVRGSGASVVRVRYDAQLARFGEARPLAIRRFEAMEPVASEAPADVAAALSRATNRLAADLADWAGASLQ